MAEQELDPLVIRAIRTGEFLDSLRRVIAALHLDDSVVNSFQAEFVLLVDEEAIWLCPEDPGGPPHIRIGWPMVGKLEDAWGSRGDVGELVVGLTVGLLTGIAAGGGTTGVALRVPVLAHSGTVELKIPTDRQDALASEAERRRPRVEWGPMLEWVPEG